VNLLAPYGIWDARDKCWIGTAKGPNRYEDFFLARAALTILTEMFRGSHGLRFRVRLLPDEPFFQKDEITPTLSAEQVIARMMRDARIIAPPPSGQT
jgi:hypothetical protein